MTGPRSVPPTRECHWCGGARATWWQRAAWRLEQAVTKLRAWLRDHHDCCTFCGGRGHR